MLEIRQEQMDVFDDYMLKKFENDLVVHLNTHFPQQCETMGETAVPEMIHHGIKRASTYGIVVENHVSRYINLMFRLGKDFDVDPALPWVAPILTEPSYEGWGGPTIRESPSR